MTESLSPSRPKTLLAALDGLRQNPVVIKELRGRMRGARAFVVLTVYLTLMSGFASLLYFAYAASTASVSGPSSQIVGKVVFGGVVGIELFLVCFIAPAFTAGAISSERERQTYDLLRTTLLPARALVLGKLTSALSYILLLLLAAVPLHSLAFLLGGVAPEEVIISLIVLVVTALAFGSVGILFSSLMKRTLGASVLTYAFALMATLGLPLLMLTFVPLMDVMVFSSSNLWTEALLLYGFGLLVCLNPIATAVATEFVLVEQHSTFYFTVPLSGGANVPLVSPWVVYVLIYLLLSVVSILLSIRLVDRVEK